MRDGCRNHRGPPRIGICEPARISLDPILDFLRANFAYFVAVALPLAGVVLAIVKFAGGDRDEGLRIAVAALLGICLYALLLA